MAQLGCHMGKVGVTGGTMGGWLHRHIAGKNTTGMAGAGGRKCMWWFGGSDDKRSSSERENVRAGDEVVESETYLTFMQATYTSWLRSESDIHKVVEKSKRANGRLRI